MCFSAFLKKTVTLTLTALALAGTLYILCERLSRNFAKYCAAYRHPHHTHRALCADELEEKPVDGIENAPVHNQKS